MGVNLAEPQAMLLSVASDLKNLLACTFFAAQPRQRKTSFLNIFGGNAPEITGLSLFLELLLVKFLVLIFKTVENRKFCCWHSLIGQLSYNNSGGNKTPHTKRCYCVFRAEKGSTNLVSTLIFWKLHYGTAT